MKTFMQVLTDTFLDEDFAAILHLWGMEEGEVDRFYSVEEVLVQRTHEPTAARFVWEYLQPDEREVFYAVLKHDEGKGIERSVLQQLVGLPQDRFDTALAQLISYALLPEEQKGVGTAARKGTKQERKRLIYAFPSTMDILFAVGRELFQPEADRSTHSLQALLAKYSPSHLYQLCKEYNFPVPVTMSKSAGLSQKLAEAITAKENVLEGLSGLDPEIKKLYTWLRLRGGRASMHDVREFLHSTDPALRKTLHILENLALAFDTLSQGDRVLFIPQELLWPQRGEQKLVTDVQESNEASVHDEPGAIRSGEMTTLFDIATLIGVIYQQRIELTQSSTIMKRYLPKLRPLLSGMPRQSFYEEDSYTEMVFRAMGRMQLIKIVGEPDQGIKEHFEPGQQLAAWIKKDVGQQAQDFLKMWEEGYYWVDMAGTHYQMDHFYYPNSTMGRRVLLKHLGSFERGRWFPVEELLDRIWEQDPAAFQSMQSLSKKERMKHSASYVKWRSRDAELYIGSLGSTLNELGLVSLGFDDFVELKTNEFHNPDRFMLTDLGAVALASYAGNKSKKELVTQGPQQGLLVQPNFELLLLQPDFPALYDLFPFAQVNQVGLVSKLTLTQASVLKALENGYTVEQIISVLSRHSQKELPQNIVYSIRDWSRNYREVSISSILLIEVPDEAAVKVLCSASKLKKFGFRALGSTSVVTESDVDVLELRRALEKEGIVVHVKGNIASQKQPSNVTYGRFR
ncbi:MAG TPA: helicase-associated domain-containing protein [Ktedonobacteraceae bacterium]|jgi:hypothetical protein